MTASIRSAEDGSPQPTVGDAPAPSEAATSKPAANLLVGGGENCSNCGATLAVDQRYCVECGTRRGKPRFVIAGSESVTVTDSVPPIASTVAAGRTRLTAILAVIAVLVAIGIGVLIGDAAQSPVKVTLTGGGSVAAASAHGSSPKTPSKTGSSTGCTKGTAGCKNGKQTGQFFGG